MFLITHFANKNMIFNISYANQKNFQSLCFVRATSGLYTSDKDTSNVSELPLPVIRMDLVSLFLCSLCSGYTDLLSVFPLQGLCTCSSFFFSLHGWLL